MKNNDNAKSQSQPNLQDKERRSSSGTQVPVRTFNSQASDSTTPHGVINKEVQVHCIRTEGATVLPTVLVHVEHAGELYTIRAMLEKVSSLNEFNKDFLYQWKLKGSKYLGSVDRQ